MQHRELFEAWCEDPKNGVIIADFAVAGTLAREVLDEPKEVMSHSGHKVPALLSSPNVHHCVLQQNNNSFAVSAFGQSFLPCEESFLHVLMLA